MQAGSLCGAELRCLERKNPVHQQTGVAFSDRHRIGWHREAADLAFPVAAVGIGAFDDDAGQEFRGAGLAFVLLGDIDPGWANRFQAIRSGFVFFDAVAGHAAAGGGQFFHLGVVLGIGHGYRAENEAGHECGGEFAVTEHDCFPYRY